MALFDIFSLLLLDKCHLTRHLTHWKSIFLALVGLSWKVVCSHSFLICLDIVRIKYGFLSLSASRLLLLFYSCLLTLWHVIDRHEAWGFGQVDQMDPVIFDIMQFSKPIFDGYNQNCIKIQLLSCWSLCVCAPPRANNEKKEKQIMRNGASSKECTSFCQSGYKTFFALD